MEPQLKSLLSWRYTSIPRWYQEQITVFLSLETNIPEERKGGHVNKSCCAAGMIAVFGIFPKTAFQIKRNSPCGCLVKSWTIRFPLDRGKPSAIRWPEEPFNPGGSDADMHASQSLFWGKVISLVP